MKFDKSALAYLLVAASSQLHQSCYGFSASKSSRNLQITTGANGFFSLHPRPNPLFSAVADIEVDKGIEEDKDKKRQLPSDSTSPLSQSGK